MIRLLLLTTFLTLVLLVRHRLRTGAPVPKSHTFRDYARAALYAWFPYGPGAESISRQVLRWAAAERLTVGPDRTMAPVGILIGLTRTEYQTIGARRSGLEIGLGMAISDAAREHQRRELVRSPWALIQVDPGARPGLPTIQAYFDAAISPDDLREDSSARSIDDLHSVAGSALPIPGEAERAPSASGERWSNHAQEPILDSTVKDHRLRLDDGGLRGATPNPFDDRTMHAAHSVEVDGKVFPLHGDVVVGRGYGATVEILHPQVSRAHAVVHVSGVVAYIEDRGSFNGTYVNGARIEGTVELRSRDAIRFGPTGPVARYTSGVEHE